MADIYGLITAIGSISIGVASFLFTILRTRKRKPEFTIIDVSTIFPAIEHSTKLDSTYFSDESEKSSLCYRTELSIQNTGERSGYFKIMSINVFFYERNDMYWINEMLPKLSYSYQIKAGEFQKIQFKIPLMEGREEYWEEALMTINGEWWDHKGKKRKFAVHFGYTDFGWFQTDVNPVLYSGKLENKKSIFA